MAEITAEMFEGAKTKDYLLYGIMAGLQSYSALKEEKRKKAEEEQKEIKKSAWEIFTKGGEMSPTTRQKYGIPLDMEAPPEKKVPVKIISYKGRFFAVDAITGEILNEVSRPVTDIVGEGQTVIEIGEDIEGKKKASAPTPALTPAPVIQKEEVKPQEVKPLTEIKVEGKEEKKTPVTVLFQSPPKEEQVKIQNIGGNAVVSKGGEIIDIKPITPVKTSPASGGEPPTTPKKTQQEQWSDYNNQQQYIKDEREFNRIAAKVGANLTITDEEKIFSQQFKKRYKWLYDNTNPPSWWSSVRKVKEKAQQPKPKTPPPPGKQSKATPTKPASVVLDETDKELIARFTKDIPPSLKTVGRTAEYEGRKYVNDGKTWRKVR